MSADASKRISFRNAVKLLNAYCQSVDGKPASTNKVPAKAANPLGLKKEWWLAHTQTCPPFDSSRSRAYLKSYVHIGESIFFSSGIPLDGGRMHPDRGVMKALLIADAVRIDSDKHGLFVLTDLGRELIEGIPDIELDAP